MSIRIMSEVWEQTQLSQSETLVALAIADHADDEGVCWPTIDRIAMKARLSRRRTQQVIRNLIAAGHLEILTAGRGRGHPSRYRIAIGKGAMVAPFPEAPPISETTEPKRRNPDAKTCSQDAVKGATAIAPQSSITPKGTATEPPARARERSACRIPDDFEMTDAMRKYAEDLKLNPEWTFGKFVDHWRAASGANARKRDWPAAWRNWCRKDAEQLGTAPNRLNGATVPLFDRPRRKTRFEELYGRDDE